MSAPRQFLKGNEALAYGALHTGLQSFYGYPITPSSEVPETLAAQVGRPEYPGFRTFLQAASEVEAINLMLGAAATGEKTMTATSGPGFSLMQEGISYAHGAELPMLIANVNRAGPGLGNLGPEQTDYFAAVKGGGHGGYRNVVLAPDSVPEMAAFPSLGFSLAFRYRTPVILLTDAFLGQLKEDLEFPTIDAPAFDTSWAATGARGTTRHVLSSMHIELPEQNLVSLHLRDKFAEIAQREQRSEEAETRGARVVFVAYGICARLAQRAVRVLRERSVPVGLFRPITLAPFPVDRLRALVDEGVRTFVVVELNTGQMVEDVRLAVEGRVPVRSMNQVGGLLPSYRDLVDGVGALAP